MESFLHHTIANWISRHFVTVLVVFLFLAWRIIGSQRSSSLSKSARKEVKRWLGFKAYLQEIKQYGDLAEAQEILDQYFDYAVALDIDERLLQQVKAMGGVVPIWLGRSMLDDGTTWEGRTASTRLWYVRPWYRRGSWTGRPSSSPSTQRTVLSDAAGESRPSLQHLSDVLNGSLSTASRSLTGILNTAVGDDSDPVKVKISAFGSKTEMEWAPDTPVDKDVGDIMRKSQTLRPPRLPRRRGRPVAVFAVQLAAAASVVVREAVPAVAPAAAARGAAGVEVEGDLDRRNKYTNLQLFWSLILKSHLRKNTPITKSACNWHL